MKNLLLLAAVVIMFVSCDSAPATETTPTDSTAVVACDTIKPCVAKADSTVADSTKK